MSGELRLQDVAERREPECCGYPAAQAAGGERGSYTGRHVCRLLIERLMRGDTDLLLNRYGLESHPAVDRRAQDGVYTKNSRRTG